MEKITQGIYNVINFKFRLKLGEYTLSLSYTNVFTILIILVFIFCIIKYKRLTGGSLLKDLKDERFLNKINEAKRDEEQVQKDVEAYKKTLQEQSDYDSDSDYDIYYDYYNDSNDSDDYDE